MATQTSLMIFNGIHRASRLLITDSKFTFIDGHAYLFLFYKSTDYLQWTLQIFNYFMFIKTYDVFV